MARLVNQKKEKKKIIILTTGGTIEKCYSEYDGSLKNRQSRLKKNLLSRLRLPHTEVHLEEIMAKDSLFMTDQDRGIIWERISHYLKKRQPILVLHGTDTMVKTAEFCHGQISRSPVAVVFTGAMKPVGFEDSDAYQNFIEALCLCQVVEPDFYISFHNQIFKIPHVRKNRLRKTFEYKA